MNIYEELCKYENLELAFKKARKGKTQKQYVFDFEKNLNENLLQLRTELLFHTYQPSPLKTFILRDPKTRKISKSAFKDRVIHHAICNVVEPVFEKTFIFDSFANRISKGTLNAIKRFDVFKRKVSKNNTVRCYVLKADIKSYFEAVNHNILINILKKKVDDKRLIWLIRRILSNHQGKESNKGMPLGNLTSQFFANVYLNELDQFIKQKLRIKYYIRYVDDFVILHQSKTKLGDYKKLIEEFIKNNLDLKLHPEKSQIIKLEKGINFLGFRIFYYHRLLARKNMRKFKIKINTMRVLYDLGKIDREKVIEKYEGWIAYSSNANTYKYRKNITKQFNMMFPVKQEINIISVKKHENFNKKLDNSNMLFTQQKTLQMLKKGYDIKKIAKLRNIKEGTIWAHVSNLIEHYQVTLKSILPSNKIRTILKNIKSPDDKLSDIKQRISDTSISYNEIQVVLANVKGKHKKKSISYYVEWYQKTNCFRKCHFNKNQREECRIKFQQLVAKEINMEFTKHEFLDFFHNYVKICTLSDDEKKRFMSWNEFKQVKFNKQNVKKKPS